MNGDNIQDDLTISAQINLYYDLYVGENVSRPAPLLISVHGYGAHKRYMMREARAVAPEFFVIASVQGPYQHFRKADDGYHVGFGWLTGHRSDESVALHHKFLLDVIERHADEGLIDPERVYLLGFSQACALNFRFALTYPEALRGIIGISGGIPGDLETNPKYRTTQAETLYLYGDDDEFYPIEKFEEFEGRLRQIFPNFRAKRFNAPHEITDEMRHKIRKFLADAASIRS